MAKKKAQTENRRAIAFHEAGHAVAAWLFGEIPIQITVLNEAMDVARGRLGSVAVDSPIGLFSVIDAMNRDSRAGRQCAARAIVGFMAGPCAEGICTSNHYWYREMVALRNIEGSDAHWVLEFAAQVYLPEARRHQRWLATLRDWTQELLSAPRVWTVVETLALQLTATDVLDDLDAMIVMDEAWGTQDAIPIESLGARWRRRFQ